MSLKVVGISSLSGIFFSLIGSLVIDLQVITYPFISSFIFFFLLQLFAYVFYKSIQLKKKGSILFGLLVFAFILGILVYFTFGIMRKNSYIFDQNSSRRVPSWNQTVDLGNLTKEEARSILLSKYPELIKDPGLPPHMFYYYDKNGGWIIVYTSEGSGVKQIFSADCYMVKNDAEPELLGKYKYEQISSFMLVDIKDLDEETCKVKV